MSTRPCGHWGRALRCSRENRWPCPTAQPGRSRSTTPARTSSTPPTSARRSTVPNRDGRAARYIGMDACLMAMVKGAARARDLADYFVGFTGSRADDGWPSGPILAAMNENRARPALLRSADRHRVRAAATAALARRKQSRRRPSTLRRPAPPATLQGPGRTRSGQIANPSLKSMLTQPAAAGRAAPG